MVEVSIIVTADVAELIDTTVTDRVAERGGWPAVRADAAIELLAGSAEPHQVTLDIELALQPNNDDADAEVDGDPTEAAVLAVSGARLPAEVAKRYGCDGAAQVTVVDNTTAEVIGVGRRTRIVPRWLRRRLERRDDHTCQFPTCTTTHRLHAHHIIHWVNGGPTTTNGSAEPLRTTTTSC